MADDEDSWWSAECGGWDAPVDHAACDLRGCDCSCHYPALIPEEVDHGRS